MAITAAQVKELRERTGSGMMECKKALTEVDGDMEAAIEALRKSGLAKADKKAGRVAAEGLIHIKEGGDGRSVAILEVNCETDFVAKKEEFQDFVSKIGQQALDQQPNSLESLMELPISAAEATSVDLVRKELIAKIGENIKVRRFVNLSTESGTMGAYLHGTRIGAVVELEGGDAELAKDIAMHVAASNPLYANESEVPQEVLNKEKEILVAQAQDSGKPAEIIEKMVQGRIKKYLAEITLVGQPFVKDPDVTVGKLLSKNNATLVRFERVELGEGIEKKTENFADEVMAQVQGN